jgi:hypothetical protein
LPFVVDDLQITMLVRVDIDEIACPRDVRNDLPREVVVGRLFAATGANILVV